MGSKSRTNARMAWWELCRLDEYRGRWVALDNVRYDPVTSQPIEGEVVDADEDLADLCARMRSTDRTACAILHCDDDDYQPVARRPASQPPRAAHHQ
jgi:hypothetical protein